MSKSNSGWVRRQTAVLLSATLALSPVMAVPAFAAETGDDAPLEQTQGTENADAEQSAEKDEAVEKDVEPEETADSTDSAEANADPAPAAKDSVPASNDAAPQADGVVEFDGQTYDTLSAAFNAARAGGTIILTGNLTVSETTGADARELTGDVTLDLGGHTVYGANNNIAIRAINCTGSLTITNGTIIAQSGTFCTVGASAATLTLDGVTLHNETQYGLSVKAFEGGHAILRNCMSTSTNGSGAIAAAGGTVDVYGGSYTQQGYYDHNSSLLAPSNGTGVINVYGGTFTAEGSGIYVFSSGGTINFYDGNLSVTGTYPAVRGDIDSASYPTASGSINIYGGSVTGNFEKIDSGIDVKVSGGKFTSDAVENYLAPGFTYDSESDTVSKNEDAVVTVTDTDGSLVGAYESLQDAVNAVPDGGTVTLTENTSGNGVVVSSGTNFTLDLGGFTYTVDGNTVGSAGTETNGFQLLKDSDILIKNGTIASNKAKILIQNYSNLTLEGVTLDGGVSTQYTLSNNNGEVHIGKGTNIYAGEASPRVAFDVCRYSSYPSVHVTVDEGAGQIVGAIELSASGNSAEEGFSLTINGGDLSDAELSVASGGELAEVEKTPAVSLSAPEGYQWIDGTLKEVDSSSDPDTTTVASITDASGNVTYFSTLANAISAASEGQTIALLGDVTESVTVPEGKSLTLDLAGRTLTNTDGQHTVTVEKGATLTVTDSSADKDGVIDNVSHGKGALVNYGTATVEGGKLTRSAEASTSPTNSGGNSWYVVDNQGTLAFNGGSVVNDSKFSSLIRNLNGTLTINDGTFENDFIALKNDDGGTLTVAGGTVTSAEQSIQSWSTTNVTGGTLNGRVTAWDYADSPNESVLTVSGGTINGDVQAINYMNAEKGPEVHITGGAINGSVQKATHDGSTGTKPADPTADTSVITISGGTFKTAPDEQLIVPGSGLTQNSDGSFGIHEHIGMAVAAKDPTCTEAGNKAYWECSECHELFLDEAMTQPTTREDVTTAATGHQHVTHVEAKDATETETGNLEYWYCADCGRYFSDAALSQETTLAELTIPAKGQEPADKPKDEDVEKDDSLAQTGDATAVAPLVASAVAGVSALAAGAVTLRKRK